MYEPVVAALPVTDSAGIWIKPVSKSFLCKHSSIFHRYPNKADRGGKFNGRIVVETCQNFFRCYTVCGGLSGAGDIHSLMVQKPDTAEIEMAKWSDS